MRILLILCLVVLSACQSYPPTDVDSGQEDRGTETIVSSDDPCAFLEYEDRLHCYQELGESTKNASLCPRAEMESLVQYCYIHLAKDTTNLSMCELAMPEYRGTCYKNYAIKQRDESVCRFVDNLGEMRYCYRLVAQAQQNVSTCAIIDDASEREYCVAEIEGCAPPADTNQTRESCESAGGVWGRGGLLPTCFCNYPSPNADKPCTDTSDCGGFCLIDSSADKTGTCARMQQVFGCFAYLEDGESREVCVD
ncbi:hypothetical protein HY641_02875 [Candidatus Woesearchaeota archaeon]|nr:hypothetical protein [Candidatus Woesearchaeota archaeon]